MGKTLLKNGEVVSSKKTVKADVLIEDGKIVEVGEDLKVRAKHEEIDCEGKLILPGLIDVHVHFREPGAAYKEDWVTGSSAAVAGGVTTVCDMPNNNPPIVSCQALEEKRKLIKGRSYVNYGLYMGAGEGNIDEINAAKGICGVKVYCAHSTGNMGVGEDHLKDFFTKIDPSKLLILHSEDEACISEHAKKIKEDFGRTEMPPSVHSKIRAPECALKMTEKLCKLAQKYKRHIHIAHVSTDAELDVISEYTDYVTCEVAPHHLAISDDDYTFLGNYIKMNPPVRDRDNVFGLWKHLKMGNVDIIATDHAPHAIEEKDESYLVAPSGVPGVEMMLPILLNTVNNHGLDIEDVVRLCCERPAEIFGMKKKGMIKKGYDADIVIVDMAEKRECKNEDVFSKCGWTPYAGSVFEGWPIMTFVGGEKVFENGKILGEPVGVEVRFR